MASKDLMIARAATRIAIVATTLAVMKQNVIQYEGEEIVLARVAGLEELIAGLNGVTEGLLNLLDDEIEDEPGLTD